MKKNQTVTPEKIDELKNNLELFIDKQLDIIREAAKNDCGKIFEYQTILWNIKSKISNQ